VKLSSLAVILGLAKHLLGLAFVASLFGPFGEIKAKLLFSAYGSKDMPGDL
jgi:hypothetical protein